MGLTLGLVVLALAGPPSLPPLPGRGQPTPPEPEPAQPAPPAPAQPTPARPVQPKAQPTAPAPTPARPASPGPTPAPSPTEVVTPPPGASDLVEPPQPQTENLAPADPPPKVEGPGAAPAMGEAGEIPRGVDDDERPALPRLPPPRRPPYRGTGMFIGAGATFAIAIAEQVVAHILVKRRCIDPIAADAMMDPMPADPMDPVGNTTDELGEIVSQCAPGVVPALALRVHSDLGLLAAIGLTAGGGTLRGRQAAWDAVFSGTAPARDYVGLRAAGIAMIGTGAVTWFSTGAGSWAWLTSCRDAKCATRARLLNFTMRDVSAALAAAGAGMLAFSEVHRRAVGGYERDKILSVGFARTPGGALLVTSGRF